MSGCCSGVQMQIKEVVRMYSKFTVMLTVLIHSGVAIVKVV